MLDTPGQADSLDEVPFDAHNQSDAQKAMHRVRFPRLDDESLMCFTEGFKRWITNEMFSKQARQHFEQELQSRGLPVHDETLSYEGCFDTMVANPAYAARLRLNRSAQHLMWDRAFRAFHKDADACMAALEATDSSGPGRLELNPELVIPDYARHEIHTQPGGYVGDAFAGWAFHWALTQAFFQGRNDFDQEHLGVAQFCPKPVDGKVGRIIDLGCGSGLSTTAFKERFPATEVWGLDVGGPMVRYAHHRAANLGMEVHFVQRLAEATGFPDAHFDIVSDFLLFHEVPTQAARRIAEEIFRILRPGGIFNHVDVVTRGYAGQSDGLFLFKLAEGTLDKAQLWENHRHNIEPWTLEYTASNFPEMLRQVGFDVDMTRKSGARFPLLVATKPTRAP